MGSELSFAAALDAMVAAAQGLIVREARLRESIAADIERQREAWLTEPPRAALWIAAKIARGPRAPFDAGRG